jgi:hypothetical protein
MRMEAQGHPAETAEPRLDLSLVRCPARGVLHRGVVPLGRKGYEATIRGKGDSVSIRPPQLRLHAAVGIDCEVTPLCHGGSWSKAHKNQGDHQYSPTRVQLHRRDPFVAGPRETLVLSKACTRTEAQGTCPRSFTLK